MAKNNGSTTETPRVISVSVRIQGKWHTFPVAEGDDPLRIMVRYSNGRRALVLTGQNQELGCECIEAKILEWGRRKPCNVTLTPLLPLKAEDYNGNGRGNGHT